MTLSFDFGISRKIDSQPDIGNKTRNTKMLLLKVLILKNTLIRWERH